MRYLGGYRIFLLTLLCVVGTTSAAAELRTFLEPRLVDEMDTVRLTIRADGSSQSEAPDLSPLMDDFEVLGNQTSSRISSINGRTVASVEYQISLRPRRTGELTVPSLTIGTDASEAIQLIVRPLDPELKQAISNMVFFETELTNNPVYVQAETILTRRLYYSQGVQIYSDLPGVPEIGNAVVIPLGETQSRSTLRGGQRYGVIEQRFALFPERSGSLTIPSISVTSSVRLQTAGRTRRSGIRVSTEQIELQVLPIPAEYPADASWLPATDVALEQSWESQARQVEVGEPLNFSLRVRVTGNRGSAIPPVPLPLPAQQFKIYPEAPIMEESADTGTVIGSRSENYALIPTEPGVVSVPPIRLVWWDTTADQLRQTGIEVDSLTINGSASSQPITAPVPAVESAAEPSTSSAAPVEPSRPAIPDRTLIILALALLGLLGLAALIPLSRRFLPDLASSIRARRTLEKAMKVAARQTDLAEFRAALTDYLSSVYDCTGSAALDAFRDYPDAALALRVLDQALYAVGETSQRQQQSAPTPDLALLMGLARAAADQHAKASHEDALPALYS